MAKACRPLALLVCRLIRLSAPFGTHVRDVNGVAVVDPGTAATRHQ